MINEEPKAWIKKYFKADSDEHWFLLFIINGINDIKFNSNPTHAPNHDGAEIDRNIPIINVKKNIRFIKDI